MLDESLFRSENNHLHHGWVPNCAKSLLKFQSNGCYFKSKLVFKAKLDVRPADFVQEKVNLWVGIININ